MPSRRGEAWNDADIALLRRMARAGEPLAMSARVLERSQETVAGKARRLKVTLGASR